jgi:hypothetical protein
LIVPGSRFSVNMIATITNQGKVRWMIYPGKMNAALFIGFLTRLIAGAAKKVFLIVDHLSVHEAAVVDQGLADKTDRIEVFYLPKYAPERNPDEYLNCDVKANINTEGLPKDREELRGKRHRFMQKLARVCRSARTEPNMSIFLTGLIRSPSKGCFDRSLSADRQEHQDRVTDALRPRYGEIVANNPRNEHEVMNLACLIRRDQQKDFEQGVIEVARLFDNSFAFDFNGPWPPHNFVEIDLKL